MRRPSRLSYHHGLVLALLAATLAAATSGPSQARQRSAISASTAFDVPDPLVIVVSLRRQRLTVYDANGIVTDSPVSSGQPEFPTPTGVFSVIGKEVEHESNIYEGAAMPFMQRLTWTGTALHAGQLPGYAASHGCIRLPWGFSKRLFEMTLINTRVIVTNDDPTPLAMSHPRLFSPPVDVPPPSQEVAMLAMPSRVASLVGVSSAIAAPVVSTQTDRLPLTARAKARLAETARLFEAIATAEATRLGVVETMKSANRAVEAAKADKSSLENTIDDSDADIAKLAKAKKGAQAQIAAFLRKAQVARTDEQLDALALAEEAAETKLLEIVARHEAAQEARALLTANLAIVDAQVAAAETRRRDLDEQIKAANLALKTAQTSYNLAKRDDARYAKPVSVLVSRKDQRMYVRQGFETVLDVPVAIENPDQPLGTHVFTAMGVRNGASLAWSVISLTSPASGSLTLRHEDKRRVKGVRPDPTALAAKALDRISFPPEAIAAVSDVIKPGSSLIVSDEGNSQYFGAGTDLSVIVN